MTILLTLLGILATAALIVLYITTYHLPPVRTIRLTPDQLAEVLGRPVAEL